MENPDDQFSLKWNNFQSNLATGFHDLLQEEDMVDVTLAAEGKYLQAHKVILSVCSPYFRDLFKANPCKHPIVILKDVGHQELADMLDFMYRGEASVRQEDLSAFLKLAETLKVKGLAGDKSAMDDSCAPSQPQAVLPRKPNLNLVKKKRIVEATVFEPEDDPGEPDFMHTPEEPKRKRKRVPSPQPKTEASSTSAAPSFVPLVNPKQELPDTDEVEFLDDGASDALVDYMDKGKQSVSSADFEDSNLELTTGDDGHSEMDIGGAGTSTLDESSDQVPQGRAGKQLMVRTPIWNHFQKVQIKSGTRAVCSLCKRSLRLHNTSVLTRHLRTCHPSAYEKYQEDKIYGRLEAGYAVRDDNFPSSRLKAVKRIFVVKATGTEDSDVITKEDLCVLGGKNISLLSVVKHELPAMDDETSAVCVEAPCDGDPDESAVVC